MIDYRRYWRTIEQAVHHRVMTVNSRVKGFLILCAALALVLLNFFQLYYVGASTDADLL